MQLKTTNILFAKNKIEETKKKIQLFRMLHLLHILYPLRLPPLCLLLLNVGLVLLHVGLEVHLPLQVALQHHLLLLLAGQPGPFRALKTGLKAVEEFRRVHRENLKVVFLLKNCAIARTFQVDEGVEGVERLLLVVDDVVHLVVAGVDAQGLRLLVHQSLFDEVQELLATVVLLPLLNEVQEGGAVVKHLLKLGRSLHTLHFEVRGGISCL